MRLDLFIPITKTSYSVDRNLFGIIWSQIYVNFDNEINKKFQSTLRQYLGLRYRFSYSWHLEVDHVFQAVFLINKTLIIRLDVNWPGGSWKLLPYAIGSLAAFWVIQRTLSFI